MEPAMTEEAATGATQRERAASHAARERAPTRHPTRNIGSAERFISLLGGTVLTLYGLRRADRGGLGVALLGAAVLERGITGHSRIYDAIGLSTADEPPASEPGRMLLHATVTIDASPRRLYEIWRQPENLSRFLTFFESVEAVSETRTRWRLAGPLGRTLEWETEVAAEVEESFIFWQSVSGSSMEHDGEVRFQSAPGGRGSEVRLWLTFYLPGGSAGSVIAWLLDGPAELKLRGDLKRFKQWVETGEIATTEGQPEREMKDCGCRLSVVGCRSSAPEGDCGCRMGQAQRAHPTTDDRPAHRSRPTADDRRPTADSRQP